MGHGIAIGDLPASGKPARRCRPSNSLTLWHLRVNEGDRFDGWPVVMHGNDKHCGVGGGVSPTVRTPMPRKAKTTKTA
jgi:hypothetical protein